MSALEELFSGSVIGPNGTIYDCVEGGDELSWVWDAPDEPDEPKKYAKFDESLHPRGQPDNKGQFVEKGGSSLDVEELHADVERLIDEAAADYKSHGIHAKSFIEWFGDWENDPAHASKVVDENGEPQETYSMGSTSKPHLHPKAVYHGTSYDIESFDPNRIGIVNYGKGFYFTEDKKVAESYAEARYKIKAEQAQDLPYEVHLAKNVEECYLNIRNPLDLDQKISYEDAVKLCDEFEEWGKENNKELEFGLRNPKENIKNYLRDFSGSNLVSAYAVQMNRADNWEGEFYVGDLFRAVARAYRQNAAPQDAITEFIKHKGYDGIVRDDNFIPGKGYSDESHRTWIAFEPTQIKAVDNRGTFDPKDERIKYAKWDSSKHPRGGKGTKEGGRFVRKGASVLDDDDDVGEELQHEAFDAAVPKGHHWSDEDLTREEYEEQSGSHQEEMEAELPGKGENYENLVRRVQEPDGGFTYQPYYDEEPKTGYMVSPYPDRSKVFKASRMKPVDLVQYIIDNADKLKDKNHFVGAWNNPKTGKVYLDVSVRVATAAKAKELCLAHDQIAYFDLNELKSVEVNAKASSGQKHETVDSLIGHLQKMIGRQSLGIPRDEMPQMRGRDSHGKKVDAADDFIRYLKDKKISVDETTMPASEMKPSQGELDAERVKDLTERDSLKKIFVTSDDYILDGHHHWAAALVKGELEGKDPNLSVHKLGIDFHDAYTLAKSFVRKYDIQPKTT